jgi:hypothetical protein
MARALVPSLAIVASLVAGCAKGDPARAGGSTDAAPPRPPPVATHPAASWEEATKTATR